MTLQQLKYVTAVAETGTISGAAQALFLSQPSLTAAIHDLEQELNITIFSRTNRGVALTPAGDEFLGYARQVLEQTDLIEERYTGSAPTCSSAKQIPWPVARPSPWTTWPPTPGCPMSRGSTTPSTSPRRS